MTWEEIHNMLVENLHFRRVENALRLVSSCRADMDIWNEACKLAGVSYLQRSFYAAAAIRAKSGIGS